MDGRLACGSALGLELAVSMVPEVVTPDPGQQRRLGPLIGAKPHQSSLEVPLCRLSGVFVRGAHPNSLCGIYRY